MLVAEEEKKDCCFAHDTDTYILCYLAIEKYCPREGNRFFESFTRARAKVGWDRCSLRQPLCFKQSCGSYTFVFFLLSFHVLFSFLSAVSFFSSGNRFLIDFLGMQI